MNEKQDEKEVTEEKTKQEQTSNESKKSIFKNEKAKQIYISIVCVIVGIVIGREIIANKYNSLIEEYNELENQISRQSTQISELQSKVDEAQPWFKMKDEEKKKIEEQNAKLEAERKAEEAKKAEAERLAKEEQEKNKYNTDLTYDEIARNPDQTLLKNCKFNGKVVQVLEGEGHNNLRVAVNDDYDKMILVEYDPSIVDSRILENDNVTLYGTSAGVTSYTSTMGAKITIPTMLADKIDIN